MKTRILIIIICIISFVLSACAPTAPQATVTPTPMPTATTTPTITPSPMPSPTVDLYTYSKEKLFNPIPSYDYFIANPEKVAWAPYDPWTQPEEFKKWLYGPLTTDLSLETLKFNMSLSDTGPKGNNGYYYSEHFSGQTLLKDKLIVFGVKHNGIDYPVVVVTVTNNEGWDMGTHAILLYNGDIVKMRNVWGVKAIDALNDKKEIIESMDMLASSDSSTYIPEEIKKLINLGFNAFSNVYSEGDTEVIGFGPGFFDPIIK